MRSYLPNDEFETEENRRGVGIWLYYNDFIDNTATALDIAIFWGLRLLKYAFIFGMIAMFSFWCGRAAANWLYRVVMAAPTQIYGFFVSVPGLLEWLVTRFVQIFTHDIPVGISILLNYPLSTLLTIAFLHLFLRAVLTTSWNTPEPDSTIRGSRIEGSFDDSFDYFQGEAYLNDEDYVTSEIYFTEGEESQNRRILWLFPGRRWLISQEKQDLWDCYIRILKEFAEGWKGSGR